MQLDDIRQPERLFWAKYDDEIEVQVKYITREALRDIYAEATKTSFANHQKQEEFDPIKADLLLGRATIRAWKGINDGDSPAPCTPENIDLLMRRHNTFAKFINAICVDLDLLLAKEREQAKKN